MSNNIIDLKDFDINKINFDYNKKYKELLYYKIDLNYDNEVMPLINLGEINVNNMKKKLIFSYDYRFHSKGLNDKTRYKLNIYKDMFSNNNNIINFSDNLKEIFFNNKKIDEILNNLHIKKNKIEFFSFL